MVSVRIGVIGDFEPSYLYHSATNLSLDLTARRLSIDIAVEWISTDSLSGRTLEALDELDGLWASPGSPYRSLDGALAGIRLARERGKAFIGT